jgi:hypothetical protein
MPGLDGTGPLGLGPMTGRGMGYCMMRSASSDPMVNYGYAGLSAWPFVTFPGYTVLRVYGMLVGGFRVSPTGWLALFPGAGPIPRSRTTE